MEKFEYQGVDLAELLPRIPDRVKNDLPFGLIKLDSEGVILEYNMAEGEITGVNTQSVIGKNFFDDIAICTKTSAFYGCFVEGVKKGFMNTVFNYHFDQHKSNYRVRVHMFIVPDHLGHTNVMLSVRRAYQPVVTDAFATAQPSPNVASSAAVESDLQATTIDSETQPDADESIQSITAAVIAALYASSLVLEPMPISDISADSDFNSSARQDPGDFFSTFKKG